MKPCMKFLLRIEPNLIKSPLLGAQAFWSPAKLVKNVSIFIDLKNYVETVENKLSMGLMRMKISYIKSLKALVQNSIF